MTTPPGWYPDQSGTVRWFDGYRWTDAVNVPPPPKRQIALWIPLTVLTVGLALIGWSASMGLPHPLSVFNGPHLSAPGTATLRLDSGTWAVYEQVGTTGRHGPITFSTLGESTITAADIRVDGGSGTVTAESGNNSLTVNDRRYTEVARFRVASGGDHQIAIASHDQPQRDVLVTRPFSYAFRGWRGLAVGVCGGLVAAVGVVILMVSLTRRRSAPKG